jgi:hypothetical protein
VACLQTARQGILECIQVAREVVQQEGSLASLPGQWGCSLPRGLQALMAQHQPGQAARQQQVPGLAQLTLAQGLAYIDQAYRQVRGTAQLAK